MEENRIPKKVLYMNLEATKMRGRPRNRWQDEVREDGRLDGGKGWKERVYNKGMEETPENSKETSQSTHANGMNENEMPNICGPCRTELAAHYPSST